MIYNWYMPDREYFGFVWDEDKNELNKKKHKGLDFETAVRVFVDPLLYVDYDEIHSVGEDRNRYVGQIAGKYITTVIGTDREEKTRIISARRSTKKEIRLYEQNAKTIRGY
jgi:asr0755 protein